MLMEEAERIATMEHGSHKLAVIAGVGCDVATVGDGVLIAVRVAFVGHAIE